MSRLKDKVALITGAGSGIGRESALRMAEEGAAVMCADRNLEGAETTADIIQNRGGNAACLALDVASEEQVKASLTTTVSELGGLDVIFNNAGIGGATFGWEQTIAVNLTGVYNGLFHGAPGLVGLTGPAPADELAPGAGAYVASKHGVAGLTKQYAVTFGTRGVRVNAIAPGYVVTPMTEPARDIEGGVAYLESLHPLGRLGQPEEIAAAAAFLASDDASFITGVVLPVDGGYTAR
jgi:NAD(P)-dependent dehydrogenase (short-subunit alcohol dehydrogenase family)